MAATNMKLAGLEVGAIVDVTCFDDGKAQTGIVKRLYNARGETVQSHASGAEVLMAEGQPSGGKVLSVHSYAMVRHFDDAQQVRHARFSRLVEIYHGDAGVPENTDTIERYVCVQTGPLETTEGTIKTFAFQWGDTFADAVLLAGSEVLDGWLPEAVFDLDTGARIEVHVSSPIITPSEDQGVCVNALNDAEVAELASRFPGVPDAAGKALRGESIETKVQA